MSQNNAAAKMNGMTNWIRDKILPWAVIMVIGLLFTTAAALIRLEAKVSAIDGKIEMAVLRMSNNLLTNQAENAQLIARAEANARENRTFINMMLEKLAAMEKRR